MYFSFPLSIAVRTWNVLFSPFAFASDDVHMVYGMYGGWETEQTRIHMWFFFKRFDYAQILWYFLLCESWPWLGGPYCVMKVISFIRIVPTIHFEAFSFKFTTPSIFLVGDRNGMLHCLNTTTTKDVLVHLRFTIFYICELRSHRAVVVVVGSNIWMAKNAPHNIQS